MAGVLSGVPGKSQAAAKGTTYNVVLEKGTNGVQLISINNGAAAPTVTNRGDTWSLS